MANCFRIDHLQLVSTLPHSSENSTPLLEDDLSISAKLPITKSKDVKMQKKAGLLQRKDVLYRSALRLVKNFVKTRSARISKKRKDILSNVVELSIELGKALDVEEKYGITLLMGNLVNKEIFKS